MGSGNESTDGRSKEPGKSSGPISWAMRLGVKAGGPKSDTGVEKEGLAQTGPGEDVTSGLSQGKPKGHRGPDVVRGQAQNGSSRSFPEEVQRQDLRISTAPKPPSEPMKRASSGSQGKQGNRAQGVKVPIQQGPYPPPPQQFAMPYGQQPYQIQGGYPSYMQPAGQMFYPGNFRQPTNYYGQGVVSPVAQDGVTSPHAVQSGSSAFSPSSNVTPPVRQKRILRIEDPNTHEALDLKEISSRAQARPGQEAREEMPKTEEKAGEATTSIPKDLNKAEEVTPEKTEVKKAEEHVTATEATEATQDQAEIDPAPVVRKVRMVKTKSKAAIKPACIPFLVDNLPPNTPSGGCIKYTNEFLLSLRAKCKDLPPLVEPATLSALFAKPGNDRGDWKGSNRGGPPPPPRGRGPSRQNSRGGVDSDTWERGKPLPPHAGYGGRGPPPGMRLPSGPLPALHRSDAAYKVGKTTSEDPEEEVAQKALKSMLNKITPENFNKITEQIIDKINEKKKAKTLMGFINQIFDKALRETTFAELYADLVSKLNPALPDLTDDDGNPVNFRRALLNKCQEEFDYGVNAMKAVAERERRAEDSAEQSDDDIDDSQMTDEDRSRIETKAEKKRLDKVAADAELVARKRMLGNIIFVGQLYRFGVLIEAVMHTCIKQLLEETEHPRPEDVECLCKLLTTVGRPMDSSTREIKRPDGTTIKTTDMMEVYFRRIETLIKSDKLDARHSFMLQDLVDLRNDNWVQRRKSEGPKKIGDIHRDAAIERSKSQHLDRQSSRRDRGSRNSSFDNRVDAPIRTMSHSKLGQDTNSLRPGGRPGPPRQPKKEILKPTIMPQEVMEKKVKGLLVELYHNRDPTEALLALGDLKEGGAKLHLVVDCLFAYSLEGKGTSWDLLKTVLQKSRTENVVSPDELQMGVRSLLNKLEDIRVDVPKAPEQVGDVLGFLVNEGLLDLDNLMLQIREADMEPPPDDEDTMMVDSGTAKDLVGAFFKVLKELKEDGELCSQLKGFDLSPYFPSYERSDENAVADFKKRFGIEDMF